VLEATTRKILITFGKYFLFLVFYFKKIHLLFPQKEVVCLYIIPVIRYFFGDLWGQGFVKKKKN